jgi:hypothetical protein
VELPPGARGDGSVGWPWFGITKVPGCSPWETGLGAAKQVFFWCEISSKCQMKFGALTPTKAFLEKFEKISHKSKLFGLLSPDLEHHQSAAGLEISFLLNF